MVRVENGLRRIKSFVVFDLETSGLHARTRITEIGLVAALREHISDACASNIALPRVLNKINLCVYPSRLIDLGASDVSGLDNVLLQEQKPFDCDVFTILESFLRRLPSPVCLIAHNGDRFDFPVLQAELKRLNKVLPDDVMCADSLKCFKELFASINHKSPWRSETDMLGHSTVEPQPSVSPQIGSEDKNLASKISSSDLGIHPLTDIVELQDEYDGVLFNVLENIEKELDAVEDCAALHNLVDNSGASDSGVDAFNFRTPPKSNDLDSRDVWQQNETTPRSSYVPQENYETINKEFSSPSTSHIQQQNETTPKTSIRNAKSRVINKKGVDGTDENVKTTPCRKRIIKDSATAVRKRLNFAMAADEVSARPTSFKLTDVYQFLNGSEPANAHTADGDALNLLRCIVAVGDCFLEWTDDNARYLSEVLPRN